MIRCFVYWMAADMPSMERTAAELLRYAQQRDLPESTIWAQYFHGCACYQQNDLAAAYDDFLAVMHSQHIAPGFVAIQGPIGFALVLQAQGQAEAAGAAVATVLEYAQQNNNDTARQAGLAFGAALALRQERPGDAAQWVAGAGHLAPPPVVALFAPPLAVAAILLQQGTQAAANEAEQMLGQMETYLAAAHVDRLYVEVLALQALLYAGRGQRDGALAVLARGLRLHSGATSNGSFSILVPGSSTCWPHLPSTASAARLSAGCVQQPQRRQRLPCVLVHRRRRRPGQQRRLARSLHRARRICRSRGIPI